MKRTLLIVVLVLATFAVGFSSHPASTQWEYKIETKCGDDKKLNALGAEGWELTGFSISESGLGGNWRCIFKRPKT